MPHDRVENDEILYRRVPPSGVHRVIAGKLELSSTAFNDPSNQPSVDRAGLCGSNPSHTKMSPHDGVVMLVALEVRRIELARSEPNAKPANYRVDVMPDPVLPGNDRGLPSNLAHALIVADPTINSGSRFKKLKEALARLASNGGWLIEPTSPVGTQR